MKNQRKKIKSWSKLSVICIALFSLSTLQAQNSETVKTKQEKSITVQGNVSNEIGVLVGVNVVLEGTAIGTATDKNGDFKFPKTLKKGDVLVFSSIGLESQKVIINDVNSASNIELKVDMLMTEVQIVGKAASKKVYSSKK